MIRFLGGIRFAVLLIALTALFVVAGTVLESATGSHGFASLYTYRHPLFQCLLGGFFVNILTSALRRWPFRLRHIPFLITHLGLLLILSGTMIKAVWGIQGTMGVMEGSGSGEVFIAGTQVIRVEGRDGAVSYHPIQRRGRGFDSAVARGDLNIDLLHYAPHCRRAYHSWVKDGFGHIAGLRPFQQETRAKLFEGQDEPWTFRLIGAGDNIDGAARTIALAAADNGDVWIHAYGDEGEHYGEQFRADELGSIAVFDRGFSGYGAYIKLPFATFPHDEVTRQQAARYWADAYSLSSPPPDVPLPALRAYLESLGQRYPDAFEMESPLIQAFETLPPTRKLEDNVPMVTLALAEDGQADRVTLAYDRYGSGLGWPALGGKYLVRFQPLFVTIPHHVRLRDARQINYPGTGQAYSYEADMIIDGDECCISMNNVYETWDGYRFYLANISPSTETTAKHAQIAVNYDPARYLATYPGGALVALGIVLLGRRVWTGRNMDKAGERTA